MDCQPYNIAQKWRFDNRMLDLFSKKCYLMISSLFDGSIFAEQKRNREMEIIKIIEKLDFNGKEKPLLAVMLPAIEEIKKSNRLTEEVLNNLRKPMGDFFDATTDSEKRKCLQKIATELSLHEDEALREAIYIELLIVTGLR